MVAAKLGQLQDGCIVRFFLYLDEKKSSAGVTALRLLEGEQRI